MQYHKYSLEELEEMFPFEREIYVTMLIQWLEEKNKGCKANETSIRQTKGARC